MTLAAPDRYHWKAQPSRRHALTGGQWVRKAGGIHVWVPNTETSTEDAVPPAETQPARVERSPRPAPRPVDVGVLCECGCLLRHADELCPACVIPWCRAQEEPFRRLQQERANRAGWYPRQRQQAQEGAA